MGELVNLANEVFGSDLVKPYTVQFNNTIFLDRFEFDTICDENHSYCDLKGIVVDTNSRDLYIDKEVLYDEFESNPHASMLDLLRFRILLGLGFLNVKRTSSIEEDNQYWVISFYNAISSILKEDINNEYGYNLTNEFYYLFKVVTGRDYFSFKTDENNKLIRVHYKIKYN